MKNIVSQKMSRGQGNELLNKLEAAGLGADLAQAIIDSKGNRIAMKFVSMLVDDLAKLMKGMNDVFRLLKITDGRTTEELVRDGKYNYANPDINSENFPARARKEKSVTIEFIKGDDFDHEPTSEEVLQEAEKRGLNRPAYEDGLYFGVEHPEVQREGPVVFLHEPWRDFGGDLRVVGLWSGGGCRGLHLVCFADGWGRDCRFAFVRPSIKT